MIARLLPFVQALFVSALWLVFNPHAVWPAQVTLQWSAHDPEPDGYNVYQRVEAASFDFTRPVNNVLITNTYLSIDELREGASYRFVVRAIIDGQEGPDSNEVRIAVPYAVPDSDGDGFDDLGDAFAQDPNEWRDTDADSIGDNADADDDNDGMPDIFEVQYGLDPVHDDAGADPDGDGRDNLTEYYEGTDPLHMPGNRAPDQPVILIPDNGDMDVPLALEIIVGPYSDPDADGHGRTRYQISVSPDWDLLNDGELVFDRTFEQRLTRLELVDLILDTETTYFLRVQFIDAMNATSQWSGTCAFTTADHNTAGGWDDNGNGIPDEQEVGVDQIRLKLGPALDLIYVNAPDVNNPQLGLLLLTPADLMALRALDADDACNGDAPEIMTGLIGFKLQLPEGVSTADVTIFLSAPAPASALWYKFSMDLGWEPFTDVAFSYDRQSVTLHLVDGGPGDDDGVANGLIVDPSGLGYGSVADPHLAMSADSSAGGGGCLIACELSSLSAFAIHLQWVIEIVASLIWVGLAGFWMGTSSSPGRRLAVL